MDMTITLAGEQVTLLPEPGLYWPERRTLVIADPHFGKAAAFRAAAIPVPEVTTVDNLRRLDAMLARTGARRLICLGDWLHAKAGRVASTLEMIGAWRAAHPELEMILVRGNHDVRAGDPPAEWDMRCLDEPAIEPPFAWQHAPAPLDGSYPLAGHVHPAVRLDGRGGQSLSLPCFYFGSQGGILPAFGSFTGAALIRPRPGDRVYVIAEGEIIAK
jgi:DNA ligase-associated metallophosphoesterase